jgi:single-stranded DNA-specific DHH superfamily exonuclease
MQYDVFNGDADGICALHQLRLADPIPNARLITGVKRDIALLAQVALQPAASVTVLDVSLDSNRPFLTGLLQAGHKILYIDHHYSGEIPEDENLRTYINPSANTCTSFLVNAILKGRFGKWAICGAFGDNLHEPAREMASSLSLGSEDLEKLKEIGELLNYNGYGSTLEDLHFHPASLYRNLRNFEDPLDFFAASDTLSILRDGFNEDMAKALALKETSTRNGNRVYFFPETPWARRISGVFSNLKATERADIAHAVIIASSDATYRISVRAPLSNRRDADTLCRRFPTGGGRAAAAGINALPSDQLEDFLSAFNTMYS